MKEKTGVFLSGGGARGAFHIGFFKALEEMGINPDFVCGNSVGALISAAQTYMDSDEMLDTWSQITVDNLLGLDSKMFEGLTALERKDKFLENAWDVVFGHGFLINSDPAVRLFYSLLDNYKIMNSNKDFAITTTKIPSFKFLRVYKDEMTVDNVIEYIIASVYLPAFRPKKLVDGHHYIDISEWRTYPFDMLKVKDCKKVYIVDLTRNDKKMQKDIMNAKFGDDVDVTLVPANTDAFMLDFTKDMTLESYNKGYETSMRVLSKKK